MNVNFSNLVTASLEEKNAFLLTRIPKQFLKPVEEKIHTYIADCLKKGFTPTVERLKDEISFFPQPTEVPAKVLYKEWMTQRRDEFIVVDVNTYLQDNGNKPTGIAQYMKELEGKYAILDADIIDYQDYDRNNLATNVYHSSFGIPFYDEWTNGLVAGDLITFLGGTKCYKTTILKDMAMAAFMNGENILFCSQEQTPKKMLGQFDSLHLSRSHSMFRGEITPDLMTMLKGVEKKIKGQPGKILITPRISSVAQLQEYVLSLPYKVHKVLIDGYNLMTGGGEGGYVAVGQNISDLKYFLEEQEIIGIGVTQKNRDGNNGAMGGQVKDVGSSIAIALYSDLVVNMQPKEEQLPNSPIDFYVYTNAMLNRHGEQTHKVAFQPIYQGNKFYTKYTQLDKNYNPESSNSEFAIGKTELSKIAKENGISEEELKKKFREETGMDVEETISAFGSDEVNTLVKNQF